MEHLYSRINFEEAKRIMDTEPAHVLFDVREEEEYVTGHAADAVLFPVDTITAETAAEQIPTLDTPVLLYCRSGRRSREAAEKLIAFGYTRVYDVGSLVGWPYGLEWG
ncbi:MAG: rhodanese-like domain-containing protein [Ruminococcus bromii]|nr:rhodanese-like domain-containing protein [Ruminococcus bromii]